MKRILIIEPNWLGDVLFTTPAIRAIRQEYKDAYIAVLLHKRCAPVLQDNPNIDEVIPLNKDRGIKGLFYKLSLLPKLKSLNLDTAFLFSGSSSSAFIARRAGAKDIIGTKSDKKDFSQHRVEHFLSVIRRAGIETDNKDYEFFTKEEDEKKAKETLRENGILENEPYFAINPGGNWPPKRWPKAEFAKLADVLYEKYKTKVIITGSEKDIPLGENIKNLCKRKPINLCGKTTLKQLATVLRQAKVVISNDSGPMHIAVSEKTPTIALFGPTHPNITGPYGSGNYSVVQKEVECPVPCFNKNCRKYRCMEAITVADVMEAIEKLLAKS